MSPTDHLKLRGHTWYVRVPIPRPLWAAAGKQEYVKSLKTGDLSEANRLKHAHIAAFQHRIRALARQKPQDALADLYEQAVNFRDNVERVRGQVLYQDDEQTLTYEDEFLSQAADQAREIEQQYGEQVASRFYKIAKGEGTPLSDELIENWLAEQSEAREQTRAQHRTVLGVFRQWAGEGVLVEDVDRRKAGEFISGHLLPKGLKRKTVQRYVSSLSTMWAWLVARGIAPSNPWRDQGLGKKTKRGEAAQGQWTDAALEKLLTGSYSSQYTTMLHDLVRLALVTGARLDELCSLETRDIHHRDDGYWITIREGKTEAAVREVPIHASTAHVLKARQNSPDGFVFPGLIPGGPDKKRSWQVSKAFGRYTKSLKLGEERRNFHSLRKTFIEAMEAAEVPESTTALIVGHKRSSLTYGHYSKGDRVTLRKYIDKLHYSEQVMRLIRSAGKPAAGKRRR